MEPGFTVRGRICVKSYEVEIRESDPFVWLVPGLASDERSYQDYAARLMRDLKCFFASNRCEAAEDLAADVVMRLIRKIESGEPLESDSEESRKKYVYGIARNVLREWRRGPVSREAALQEDEGRGRSLPPVDLAAEECLKLLDDVVRESLARLDPAEREILKESVLNPDFSPTLAMLAKEKGTTAPAMRQRVHRARVRFRNRVLQSDHFADLQRCFGLTGGAV